MCIHLLQDFVTTSLLYLPIQSATPVAPRDLVLEPSGQDWQWVLFTQYVFSGQSVHGALPVVLYKYIPQSPTEKH